MCVSRGCADPTSHLQQHSREQALQLTRQHSGAAGPDGRGVGKPTRGEGELALPLLCLEMAWVGWELGRCPSFSSSSLKAVRRADPWVMRVGELALPLTSLLHLGEGALPLAWEAQ